MGQHVALVPARHVNHFLPFHVAGREEVHVYAKRLLPDLDKNVLVVEQLAADPFAFGQRRRIVLNLLDVVQPGISPRKAGIKGCSSAWAGQLGARPTWPLPRLPIVRPPLEGARPGLRAIVLRR